MKQVKKMNDENRETCTRRNMLTRTALFALGGVVGGATSVAAQGRTDEKKAPPLPWKWVPLDPLETGRRAYNLYKEGGCGTGSYLSLLSKLKEKVGYTWTTIPAHMLAHGAA